MKNFWDERFSDNEFIYGKEPNSFLEKKLPDFTPGKIIFPAEGEGRNAVFAAQLGWDVYAYDFSEKAKEKCLQLAKEKKVKINYIIASHEEVQYPENFFDAAGLFYAHTLNRELLHQNVLKWLKKDGVVLFEGFSKMQLNYSSGGPKDINMLFSIEELENDFSNASFNKIWMEEVVLNEGKYHQGKASVIRAIIKK
ncbi:MAG: methyltransferase domain-containing protein [Bacteroidota bacterium]